MVISLSYKSTSKINTEDQTEEEHQEFCYGYWLADENYIKHINNKEKEPEQLRLFDNED